MTRLIQFEFDDEDDHDANVVEHDEIVAYLTLITTAGSDTDRPRSPGRPAGDPDPARLGAGQRHDPQAFEEVLRYEQPSYHYCRWTTERTNSRPHVRGTHPRDVGIATTKWDDPERFDIHRPPAQVYTFGFGPRFCLGASLARIEGPHHARDDPGTDPGVDIRYNDTCDTPGIDAHGWQQLRLHSIGDSRGRRCASQCW